MSKLIAKRLSDINAQVEVDLRRAHAEANCANYGPAIALTDCVSDRARAVCDDLRNLVRALERRGYPSATTFATFARRYNDISTGTRKLCDSFEAKLAGAAAKPEQS
jgi:hypothetical protein